MLKKPTIEDEAFKVAVRASIEAGNLILQYWPNPFNTSFDKKTVMEIFKKEGVGNYATIADKASEALIFSRIQKNPLLANHRIAGEESPEVITNSEYFWIVDPIDGTPTFRNGMPEFGISIGLFKGQEPIIGVIAMPAQKKLIVARINHGVKLLSFNGELLADLSQRKSLPTPTIDKALVGYDLGYKDRSRQLAGVVGKIADKVGYTYCYGSVSNGNFRLALGLLSAFFCENPTIFDIAGATVIIKELGGIVTDLKGKPINWQAKSRSYLATIDPKIHHQLLEIINQ